MIRMLLNADLYLLGLCAVFFVARIRKERKADDERARNVACRFYQGDLDT